MSDYYYTIQFEPDSDVVICETPHDVYNLLKKMKLISVLRYNDSKTGKAFSKAAEALGLSSSEQEHTPVYIRSASSEDGVFVKDIDFWIENYMFDEFYNPERTPYIEKIIKHNNDDYC